MKILINLQAGSVRVSELRNTLRFVRRLCWRKVYLETIEVVDPVLSVEASLEGRLTARICSTRIDFQLGTNAADTNGLSLRMEVCGEKKSNNLGRSPCNGSYSDRWWLSLIGSRSAGSRVLPIYPQSSCQNAPKKCIHITAVKVLVHKSCADCNPAVIQASHAVGACIENLSQ